MTKEPMTRDPELLERALTYLDAREDFPPRKRAMLDGAHDLHDFACAEKVRELEALREARLHRVVQTDKWSEGWNDAIECFDARLSALRGATDNGPGRGERERLADESRAGNEAAAPARPAEQVVGGSREGGPGSDAHADSQVRPSSALSDADVLDRAAEIWDRDIQTAPLGSEAASMMRQHAAKLRAPAPDWADRLASEWLEREPTKTVQVVLRERVGPLVEVCRDHARRHGKCGCTDCHESRAALAKLEGGAE